jgi:hypothetical protein
MSRESDEELLRRFNEVISGMELADLQQLGRDLSRAAGRAPVRPQRPDLRRPPLPEPVLFRVRVDLDSARPRIWRRLDIRSDITLDVVHQVLQAAFAWDDSHLHRFSLGGAPFERTSQLFLCPYDVEEGEDEGIAADRVRLDETVQGAGDVLNYVYDYGDGWALTLRVEGVGPAPADAPAAVCDSGSRAAPPEDCGGLRTAEDLAEVLDDPAHFDPDEVNQALHDPYFVLREAGVNPLLVDLMNRLRHTNVGDDLVARAMRLTGPQHDLPGRDDSLRAFQWFLDRAGDDGIPLTSAGYLKPADVEAACEVVPSVSGWIGKRNREVQTWPLLEFRESLQSMGLLRKRKGRLLVTRAGAKARRDPDVLWEFLASRLVPEAGSEYQREASVTILLFAATSGGGPLPWRAVAKVLAHLGWRREGGAPLRDTDLRYVRGGPYELLSNVTTAPDTRAMDQPVSPEAAALARAALLRG